MHPPTTLRELFKYNDWARDKVMELAVDVPDAGLDREFEMGMGTLRKTLHHIWAAERIWLDRWQEKTQPKLVEFEPGTPVATFWEQQRNTAEERNALLDRQSEGGESRRITFTRLNGETCTYPLGDMMMHVCNHGTYHRAQASNMLRHAGSPVPPLDYLFMRVEFPTAAQEPAAIEKLRQFGLKAGDSVFPQPRFDRDTLLEYLHYGDWAMGRVLDAAAPLSDAQLDQQVEMGWGTLRLTLTHIYDAEAWWQANWAGTGEAGFQKLPATTTLASLRELYNAAVQKRDAYLGGLDDAGVSRVVFAHPMPGMRLGFRVGESLFQLCGHGTHHRAQAVNMLRRLGVKPPEVDYIVYVRSQASN